MASYVLIHPFSLFSIDAAMPTAVDDELWTMGSDSPTPPVQPEDSPSYIEAFVYQIRLAEILSTALDFLVGHIFSKFGSTREKDLH